jgi:hypothetical protein
MADTVENRFIPDTVYTTAAWEFLKTGKLQSKE